jgi:hypothetical protein
MCLESKTWGKWKKTRKNRKIGNFVFFLDLGNFLCCLEKSLQNTNSQRIYRFQTHKECTKNAQNSNLQFYFNLVVQTLCRWVFNNNFLEFLFSPNIPSTI